MSKFAFIPLLQATWQTIYMVFISSFISIVVGLLLGAWLFLTNKKQQLENKPVNLIVGFIVNVTRSVPFIILMISIIPFTRLLVGTSIGIDAAIVPLTLCAIPFYARVAESAFAEVPNGLLEAGNAMGANTWQILYKFLIPEALPGLIKAATLTVIGLVGYSAMAGVVGGGGLGELAINYGYERFNVWVMLETVILLVIIVQLVQSLGDYFARKRILKPIAIASIVLWILCITTQVWPAAAYTEETLKVGIMGGNAAKVMEVAKKVAKQKYDLNLKLVIFDDYTLPNIALNDGNIDANIFQSAHYLNVQKKEQGYKISPIAKTFLYPLGFYSRKIKSINELPNNAIIAIPNDPSDEGRALIILQQAKLIKLKAGVGLSGTIYDIVSNPKHLRFKLLDAAQLPRVFSDAYLVALTNNYLKPAGFTLNQALLKDGKNSPYANVIAVRTQDKDRPIFKKLIAVMHSKQVLNATLKLYPDGAAVKSW